MKQLTLASGVAMLLLAGIASAAYVGVYFDESAVCDRGQIPPNVPTPVFLIFTDMTAPNINAWEINLRFSNVTLVSLQPRSDNIIVSPWPGDYMCGLAQPQQIVGGSYVAADLTILAHATGAAGAVFGDGVQFHLMAEKVPCYTDSLDNSYELMFGLGSGVLASINGGHPCVVGAEARTFGAIKSLFR